MPVCHGNADDHCCYFGEVCKHLEENTVEGRRWACGLYVKYGSWDKVYESEEWPDVYSKSQAVGLREGFRCGDWPYKGQKCYSCGAVNG